MMATSLAGIRQIRRSPWLWSFLGTIAVLVAIEVVSHHFSMGDLTVNLGLGGFLVVAGVGQMFVITGGNGGIDLSVPWVITLSAITTSAVMHSHNGLTLVGALAAVGTGLAAGVVNGVLVLGLQLAPIVATLASGFVMQSLVQITYGAAEVGGPSTALENFVRGDIFGLPSMLWVALLATVLAGFVMQFTIYGSTPGGRGAERACGPADWHPRCAGAFPLIRHLRVHGRAGRYLPLRLRRRCLPRHRHSVLAGIDRRRGAGRLAHRRWA